MSKTSVPTLNKMSAEEVENNLLPLEALAAKTEASKASVAAARSRKKASKAADQTASAAKSVAKTKEATKATLAEAERGHPRSALSRAAATADKEAKAAKKAASAAEQMAARAVALALESEGAATEARQTETAAIKAGAKAKGTEIEIAQAERAKKPEVQSIKAAKRRLAKQRKQTEAKEAAAEAATMKVTALASQAKAEAMTAAKKVEEAALAVKRTELAASKAEAAVRGRNAQTGQTLANTRASVGHARKETEAAVDDTRASAKAAEKLEIAAAAAHAAAASKVDAERAALRAKEAADKAARSEAETGKNLKAPELYLNRELTWLEFNKRVLHEAEDIRTPLLERVKFLAIVGGNLDEFFMKRIGGLKQQVGAGIHERTVDGRSPQDQIQDSVALVRDIQSTSKSIFLDLKKQLQKHDISIADYGDLLEEEQAGVRAYYLQNIFPLVTPLAMDPAHPFPHISNLSLNLLVTLQVQGEVAPIMARVKVPTGNTVPRFIRVGSTNRFVPLEDVMANNLDVLFPDVEVMTCEVFRVTRNANTEREEDAADDLLEMIEGEVRDRKFAPIVRLETAAGIDPVHRGMLAAELGLDEDEDVFESDVMLGMRDLFEIASIQVAELHDPDHHPIDNVDLDGEPNIFHAIRNKGPFLLQHPYESFNTSVVRFVREACHDPKVMAIKMTLYRTTEGTGIIDYLIEAAQNGKQVAVAVELKARFDEAANINWATRLEEAGIHVTYGIVGLKTHSKLVLVIRRDFNGLRHYAHIGTGNYHAGTARMYADFGLLTCDEEIGSDLVNFFNFLTSGCQPLRRYSKILVSPRNMKEQLLNKIDREISKNTSRSRGLIRLKTNALEDPDITEALYRASRVGVKVELIVRDTCRLRPGIAGLSDNITVISVVGRFLEHARIYYFQNGGKEEFYIGSADLMQRNLKSRAEVIVQIEDEPLVDRLREYLDVQLSDQRNVWDMDSEGAYVQRRPKSQKASRGCQQAMIDLAEKRHQEAKQQRLMRPKAIARRSTG
ncbi:MAG: polyphosphate kinase 1 [Hyphomicrobiales bacterium]|nr:polyphosphate kinase 1 [Hyphomicrobiales bacterium]